MLRVLLCATAAFILVLGFAGCTEDEGTGAPSPAATAQATAAHGTPGPGAGEGGNEPSERLSKESYSDPDGFFTVVPPAGWDMQDYPEDPRGKVAFIGPAGTELRVLAKGLAYSSFEDMLSEIEDIEKRSGTSMDIQVVTFLERPAVKRNFTMGDTKILTMDFMEGNVTHNLWYSAPEAQYERYLTLATTSMNTYEATYHDLSSEDIQKHAVAHNLRLAQIFFEQGDLDLASQYVENGLEIDPANSDLLKLKRQIENQ